LAEEYDLLREYRDLVATLEKAVKIFGSEILEKVLARVIQGQYRNFLKVWFCLRCGNPGARLSPSQHYDVYVDMDDRPTFAEELPDPNEYGFCGECDSQEITYIQVPRELLQTIESRILQYVQPSWNDVMNRNWLERLDRAKLLTLLLIFLHGKHIWRWSRKELYDDEAERCIAEIIGSLEKDFVKASILAAIHVCGDRIKPWLLKYLL